MISVEIVAMGDGTQHVHAAGCRDLDGRRYRAARSYGRCVQAHASLQELIEDFYGHQIDEGSSTWESYTDEVQVFPCVRWPA